MGLSLNGIVAYIRRWWFLLLIVPLVAGSLTFWFGTTRTPMYASSATLLVAISPSAGMDGYTGNLLAQELSLTYQTLAGSDPVLETVAARANPPLTVEELRDKTTVAASSGALFTVTVVDPDPDRAAELVNAVSRRISGFVGELSATGEGAARGPGTVTTVVAGSVAAAPYAPRLPAYLALGIIAGIVIVNLGILLYERLDTRVRSNPDVARIAGAPPIARIPALRGALFGPGSIFVDQPQAVGAGEAIRTLRTAVLATHPEPGSVVVVASPNRHDGKTMVAANLATALANAGKLVVLIDGNLHDPQLHQIYQISNRHGLGGLLTVPESSWKSCAIRISSNLAVLPAGPAREHPADLLVSSALGVLLADIATTADVVIVDSPSLDVAHDALALAMHASSVVLLCQAGGTRAGALTSTADAFLAMGADLLGVVVNERRAANHRSPLQRIFAWRFRSGQAAPMNTVRGDSSNVPRTI